MPPQRIRIVVGVLGTVLTGLVVWRVFFAGEFRYAGTIEATEVDVPARIASVIAALEAHEGQEVPAGAVLVRLAGEDIRLAADLNERNYQRALSLFNSGSMAQAEFDRIRYLREDSALKTRWLSIKAPLAGTVLNTYFEAGEMVGPGARVATLADLAEVWAWIYLPQPALASLKLGEPVTGSLPELRGKAFPGRLAVIRDKAEFTPKNVQTREERTRLVFGVKVVFPNPDRVLKPGMTIEVRLAH